MLLNKKTRGQALLIVIVISTLALLIMLSLANRIILSRVNVQRTEEFDRSVAIAENKVNEIIRLLDAQPAIARTCLQDVDASTVTNNYVQIECAELDDAQAKIYARRLNNSSLQVSSSGSLSLLVANSITQTKPVAGINMTCDNPAATGVRFLVTRVYVEGNFYYTDKGTYTCGTALNSNASIGNVILYSTRSNSQVGGPGGTVTPRNTVLIRIKPYLDSTNENVQVNTYDSSGNFLAGTGKYEFMVTGLGELGSDSVVTFERPLSGNASYSQSFFDYVYFGEL